MSKLITIGDTRRKIAKGDYSAIVYKEGDLVIAEDNEGKVIAKGEAGVDDAEVIQTALDSLTSGGVLFITKGEYRINTRLEISKTCVILGEGMYNTIIKQTADTMGIAFTNDPSTTIKAVIQDITIDGGTFNIYNNRPNIIELYRVRSINHTNIGVFIGGDTKGVKIIDCVFELPQVEDDQVVISSNEWGIVRGCVFDRRDGVENGSSLTSGRAKNLIITDNIMISTPDNDSNGLSLEQYDVLSDNPEYSFINVIISDNILINRKINVGRATTVEGKARAIQIHNNIVYGSQIQTLAINSDDVTDISIKNNTVFYPRAKGIICQYGSYINIEGNTIIESNLKDATATYLAALIVLQNAANIKIRNNKLYQTLTSPTNVSPYAISMIQSNDIVVEENEFINTNGKPIFYIDTSTYIIRRNIGYTTENSGTVTFSGDGTTTQFSIEHGLVSTPSKVQVTPMSEDASGDFYVTADDTYIYINYKTAPPSGTDNIKVSWHAEV